MHLPFTIKILVQSELKVKCIVVQKVKLLNDKSHYTGDFKTYGYITRTVPMTDIIQAMDVDVHLTSFQELMVLVTTLTEIEDLPCVYAFIYRPEQRLANNH